MMPSVQEARQALEDWVVRDKRIPWDVDSEKFLGGTDNQKMMSLAMWYISRPQALGVVAHFLRLDTEKALFGSELGSSYENFHLLARAAIYKRAMQLGDATVINLCMKSMGSWYRYTNMWEHDWQYHCPACRMKDDRRYCAEALMQYLDLGSLPQGIGRLNVGTPGAPGHGYFSGARAWAHVKLSLRDLIPTNPRVHYPHALVKGLHGHVGFVTEGLPKCWDGPAPLVEANAGKTPEYLRPPTWYQDDPDKNREHFLQLSGSIETNLVSFGETLELRMPYKYQGLANLGETYRVTVPLPIHASTRVTLFRRHQEPLSGGPEVLDFLRKDGGSEDPPRTPENPVVQQPGVPAGWNVGFQVWVPSDKRLDNRPVSSYSEAEEWARQNLMSPAGQKHMKGI